MNTRPPSLLDEIPLIRRAAGYRLYTGDGRRYLDAWQAGGAALLGHRGGRYREAFSVKSQRGLTVPLPAPEVRKLRRALATWLPENRPLRLFENSDRMYAAIRARVGAVNVVDPAIGEARDAPPVSESFRVVLARPFLSQHASRGDWVVPVLPLPAPFACAVLLGPQYDDESGGGNGGEQLYEPGDGDGGEQGYAPAGGDGGGTHGGGPGARLTPELPEGELVPVASISSVTRALHDLFRHVRAGGHGGVEVGAELAATGVWRARGPYLEANVAVEPQRYARLFRLYRDAGVVISPDRLQPSIVPADMSKGERALLLSAAQRAREEDLTL